MSDGEYTVREIKEEGRKKKLIFANVSKSSSLSTRNPDIRVGSKVKVRNNKIVGVKANG